MITSLTAIVLTEPPAYKPLPPGEAEAMAIKLGLTRNPSVYLFLWVSSKVPGGAMSQENLDRLLAIPLEDIPLVLADPENRQYTLSMWLLEARLREAL